MKGLNGIDDILALTPLQQGMLFHTLYAPESSVYNLQIEFALEGDLDEGALEQAWRTVVERHTVLRTSFVWERVEKPYQVVHHHAHLKIARHDWRALSAAEQDQRRRSCLDENRTSLFDLTKPPLMRLALIVLSEHKFRLVWTFHHIILEGWSAAIILSEVWKCYGDLRAHRSPDLPAVRPYAEFIRWLQQKDQSIAEAYWRERLKGFGAPTRLAIDRSIGSAPAEVKRVDSCSFTLSKNFADALKGLARTHRITLNTVVQGAWSILLSRYSGEPDVVFGAVVSGRPAELPGVESIVGLFVNTLPARVKVNGDERLMAWLQELQLDQATMRQYEYSSLMQVQAWSDVPGGQPLFYTALGFQNWLGNFPSGQVIADLQVTELESHEVSDQPLTLFVQMGDTLTLTLVYDVERFERVAVQRMLTHCRILIEGMVADPDQRIMALPLLTEAERRQLLVEWNDTNTDYPADALLHQLFAAQAARTPEAVAVVFEDQSLTYRELDARTNQLARNLKKHGVGPDTLVALCVERSLEMVVGILGILKAGAAYVPIDTAYPRERIAFMLIDANVSVLLTQSSLLASLPIGNAQVVCLDSFDWTVSNGPAQNDAHFHPGNLAYVIYTSGSTGHPKGVCIEHKSIVNYVLGVAERLQLKPGMNHAMVSTIAADLGNTVIFPALATGGCLHIISQERAENQAMLSDYFDRENIDVLKIVPSHLEALQTGRNPQRVMPKSCLILGGESSRLDWIERLRALSPNCEIYNHYGPTETTVGVLTYHVGPHLPSTRSGTLPLGRPLPNSRIYILDGGGQPMPVGVQGELCIGGCGVARGYLNRPDLTAEKFIPNPFSPGGRLYRTGDRARYLPDGNIEFFGRIDHQVKIHGYRVELGEIEEALREQRRVRDALVLACDDDSGNKQLVAYVVPNRANQPLWGGKALHVLPDGSTVAHLNRQETDYIYNEIFVLQAYVRHGITIHDGDVIVDAGANIGLFTVFANRLARNLRILAFEPNPAAFACLKANADAWGTGVTCLPVGLSRDERSAELTFFEGFSLLSGFYADAATEREVVKTYALNQVSESSDSGQLAGAIDELLDDRFRAKTEAAQLRALSSVIAEEGIERIDLLKINVEKSELDVLLGLNPDDWAKIRQLVIEVDQRDHLKPITTLLDQQGYEVLVEQDPLLRKTDLCYVYAIRPSAAGKLVRQQPADAHVRSLRSVDEDIVTPTILRTHLQARLPQYMIPSAFVLMQTFPLTSNGKLDRKALPAPTYDGLKAAHDFVRPHTETEQVLAAIWTEVLKVEHIGLDDNFFDLGGHSLLAIKVVSRIRDAFEVNLPTRTFFEKPTLADLAKVLTGGNGSRGNVQRIERRTQSGSCALSFAQERFWLLHQLAPASPVYNIVDVIRFEGTYEAEAMRKALKELMRRHEILRTAFVATHGQPMQIVLPTIDLMLSELDLSALSEQERERECIRVVREEGRKPFDLSQAPLLRGALIHLTSRDHQLLLTLHHIIADEWSMEVLHQEITQLYGAFAQGQPSPLPELPIQYADFACWQRDWLQGDVRQQQIAYWKDTLTGAPSMLELPTDKPRPAVQSWRGATETFALPKGLVERLKALGREHQATLFMTLEASFAALLHRYTGQEDILVGTPMSGRPHSETERLIGCFINTVVLRAQFTHDLTFRSLLHQVRERALGAYAHPDLPFEQLVAELATPRDLSRTSLFQVMFVLYNSEGVSQVSKVSGNRQLETGTSKFDLTLFISETEDGLEGSVEYSTDLFEAQTIRRLCGHFETLLEAITREPDQSISMLPLLTDAERHQQLVEWNDNFQDYPKDHCLHQLFEEQVRRTPEAVAVIYDNQRLTYRELNRRADLLAGYLQNLGVGAEVLVGICMERSLDMVTGLLGILKAGGAYVPLDPSYPRERLAFLMADSNAPVLISQQHLLSTLPAVDAEIICLDKDWQDIIAANRAPKDAPADGEKLAYVIYTSGSTGKPKGVQIAHRSAVAFAHWAKTIFTPADLAGVLASTSICFDLSVFEIFVTLSHGGKVILAPNALQLPRIPAANEVTLINTVPSVAAELVRNGGIPDSVRTVNLAGEPLATPLVNDIYAAAKVDRVYDLYGPSEDTTYSTFALRSAHGRATIGRPIANTQIYILDAHLHPVPVGVRGEIYIGGDGLARGYLRRPDLTTEKFIANPFSAAVGARLYKTGDAARYRADGNIEYLGRLDHQVKLRGFRIELGEIDTILKEHPSVLDAVVVVGEDTAGDKRLVAYLVAKAGAKADENDLRVYLKQKLPHYMIPAAFVVLPSLPLTANGKLDRRALPAPDDAHRSAVEMYVAPRNDIERIVERIWCDVLEIERLGIEENFFDIGGHSILATRAMARLRQECQIDLPLRVLFECPTIAAIGARVVAEMSAKDAAAKSAANTFLHLFELKSGDPKKPVFFLPGGVGGDEEFLVYAKLLHHVDTDHTFYGLRSRSADGIVKCQSSVTQMAADYIREMQKVQPRGPYSIVGNCTGGIVAYEIACQLEAQGQKIALLALMDTDRPSLSLYLSYRWKRIGESNIKMLIAAWHRYKNSYYLARAGYHGREICSLRWYEVLPYSWSRLGAVIQAVQRSRPRKKAQLDRAADARTRSRHSIQDTYERALRRYRPGPFHGRMTLIVNEEAHRRNPDLGWSDLVSEGIEICQTRGDHVSYIREQVQAVAEQLESILAQSEIDPPGHDDNESIPQEASAKSGKYRLGWSQ